jgi:hypothetical protein
MLISSQRIATLVLLIVAGCVHSLADEPSRARSGLQALYDFSSTEGVLVRDRARVGKPIDLEILSPDAVVRRKGSLEITGKTLIRSKGTSSRLNKAIARTGELTIEAWLTPATANQAGPARVLTLSQDGSNRNVTLGQDGNKFDVRLRTTKTSKNGIPSLSGPSGSLQPEITHVVYTRSRSGRAIIYQNGERVSQKKIEGSLSKWNPRYRLALGNEHSGDRQWRGTFHFVAIFDRDLSEDEVKRHFDAGPGVMTEAEELVLADPKAVHFETKIAPLFANHCLECHDPVTKKGKLDLSKKAAAFLGSEDGTVIVVGNSAESVLWESVESDEMPKKRTPLTDEEKSWLKQWIDDGAVWSKETIDPADYAHSHGLDQTWVQRLTIPEYIATVKSAVGVDIAKEAREVLPPDLRADGFSNTAYNLSVDLKHVEAYGKLAEIIVSRMDVDAFANRFSKKRKFTDDDMGDVISKMGQWLLRGPVEEHEVIAYRGISTSVASSGGSVNEAIGFIIEAMLQSPRFIYRVENQRGDGNAYPATEYELATRMSYILWGAPPDRTLMGAAEDGDLLEAKKINDQIARMLDDPRAIERSLQFALEWLNLGRLANLSPNAEKFPEWNAELAADMRAETLAFFKDVVWAQERPLSDLLNAQFTYATPRLAKHYGLKAPEGINSLARRDLSDVPARGGLLTQGSVLTVGGDEASMVTRGLFVFHDLLRGVVKDPPPGTDTTPIPTKPGQTQRNVAEKRISDRSCMGCHSKFEPFAFGLEKFDGLGAFHEQDEHGNTLREDGEVLFPGSATPIAFTTSAQLMDLLAKNERVQQNITWKLVQFALGRPLGGNDAATLEKIHLAAKAAGGTYKDTVTAIILSDLVQMTSTEFAGE